MHKLVDVQWNDYSYHWGTIWRLLLSLAIVDSNGLLTSIRRLLIPVGDYEVPSQLSPNDWVAISSRMRLPGRYLGPSIGIHTQANDLKEASA